MKILNKGDIESYENSKQIASNHSSDINFRDFFKKYITNPCSFLVIYRTLASDNVSCV